jgi:hypothetical protein
MLKTKIEVGPELGWFCMSAKPGCLASGPETDQTEPRAPECCPKCGGGIAVRYEADE